VFQVSFSNDNIIVTNPLEGMKLQSSCYRVSALFIIGNMTITTPLLKSAAKFGFPIILMTSTFRVYEVIGRRTEGNTALRRAQYSYDSLDIAKGIIVNKIDNQISTLKKQVERDPRTLGFIERLSDIHEKTSVFEGDTAGLMGLEGTASRIFFEGNYNNIEWNGRKPRMKKDYVNSTLDIGYTMLFNMIDSLLNMYGFDTYVGILHKEYYMRKSLTCDLMEPFRPVVDWTVRKAINLGQCKPSDFNVVNERYLLDISKNKNYISFLMKPLLEIRGDMFAYIQSYYRFFMKRRTYGTAPVFEV